MKRQHIWCCGCDAEVAARMTDGAEIYPHRPDLSHKVFWRCDTCRNYVGCHAHGTVGGPPRALGSIPTPELRQARSDIHAILDPIWKQHRMPRGKVYALISEKIGRAYHTGEVRSLDEARIVYAFVRGFAS